LHRKSKGEEGVVLKIVYVLPGPISRTEKGRVEMQRRLEVLRSYAAPGTWVDIVDIDEGPASIESLYEEYLSIPPTVDLMLEMERQGYDAAVLGCYGDPGLDAVREVTEKMVIVGPGEAGVMAAAMSGYRFSIITVTNSMVNPLYHLVEKAGVGKKLASVRAIEVPVLELAEEREKTVQKLIAEGRRAIEEDRADTLVLGCMSMGFLNAAEEMSKELGVPVINPGRIALKMAEALAGAEISHSKRAYLTPPKISSGAVTSSEGLLVKKEQLTEETQ
jgi:allantoin racemase